MTASLDNKAFLRWSLYVKNLHLHAKSPRVDLIKNRGKTENNRVAFSESVYSFV